MSTSANRNRLCTVAALLAGTFAGAFFGDVFRSTPAHAESLNSEWAGLQDQPEPSPGSPFNAGEQRKQQLVQLTEINQRLTKIEAKLNSGLSVKVTEMPPVTVKNPDSKP